MSDTINDQIIRNKGLVFKQLYKFGLVNEPDAESIAYEALFHAANTFDVSKGYQFSTYATVCIYNALGSFLRTLKKQRQLEVISYHSVVTGEEDSIEMLGLLASGCDTEGAYIRQELCRTVRAAYDEAYSTIANEKQLKILDVWQDAHFDITTSEIARNVGVSQSYVSQTLNNFKHSMKKRLAVYLD